MVIYRLGSTGSAYNYVRSYQNNKYVRSSLDIRYIFNGLLNTGYYHDHMQHS